MQIITTLHYWGWHEMTLGSKLVINIVNKIFQAFLTLHKSQGKAKFVYILRIEVFLRFETIACEGAMFRSFNCSYLKSDTYIEKMFWKHNWWTIAAVISFSKVWIGQNCIFRFPQISPPIFIPQSQTLTVKTSKNISTYTTKNCAPKLSVAYFSRYLNLKLFKALLR